MLELKKETIVKTVPSSEVEKTIKSMADDYYEVVTQYIDLVANTTTIIGERRGGLCINRLRDYFHI